MVIQRTDSDRFVTPKIVTLGKIYLPEIKRAPAVSTPAWEPGTAGMVAWRAGRAASVSTPIADSFLEFQALALPGHGIRDLKLLFEIDS